LFAVVTAVKKPMSDFWVAMSILEIWV